MKKLEQFKSHIKKQYLNILGLNLISDFTTDGNNPIWITDTNKAWLLDNEIGLALRIVPFCTAEDDLNTAIQEAVRTATQLQTALWNRKQ